MVERSETIKSRLERVERNIQVWRRHLSKFEEIRKGNHCFNDTDNIYDTYNICNIDKVKFIQLISHLKQKFAIVV